ncbi:MAG: N-acetyltransferase [Bacteroidetes bacterium]|nr:N-acetyltransferase [Bacteroidota bacterium]
MSYSFCVFTTYDDLMLNEHVQSMQQKPICRAIDMVEKSNIDNVNNYYVLTLENNIPLALSYFQLLHVKPLHFNIADKKVQQFALSLALRVVKPTLLVAGNLFRHDASFFQFLNKNLTAEKRHEVFIQSTEHLIGLTNASGIFLKDVDKSIATFIQNDTSYFALADDISMEMNLLPTWKSLADYEQTLKHKYLQRCKKMRKSFQDIKVREFSLQDIQKYSREMENLYLQVTRKQMVSMGILNHTFFEELKLSLQDDYKVCGYFYHDKLIAFSSAILHDDEYDMNYIGFDYAVNQSHYLYFNILFHCLDNALSLGCKKLILGRTALEAKAIMGCEPDYRFSFYKLRNVVVNWFYQLVSGYFREQQGEKWKDRHPFKSSYYSNEKTMSAEVEVVDT